MSRNGKAGRRAELSEMACALRAEGATQREISEILGVSRGYAFDLYGDPDGERSRIRKDRSRRPCPRCGTPMAAGMALSKQPQMCRSCAAEKQRKELTIWTREAIIAAIQEYARRYGRPPAAHNWNPALARAKFRDDLADQFYEDGCWPTYASVQKRFPRWNNAIAAAGFTPLRPGQKYVDRERVA